MILVVDTNWLISYLIKPESSQLKLLLLETNITIASSDKQIREFLAKIYFKKFRKYFKIEDALSFILYFSRRATFTEIKSEISICRDAKDNFLLSLSKDSQADYLITGDNDLLTLGKFEKTIICTLPYFIKNYFKQ
jgi:putative PIN family toxin of toxin-antitoxin system